MLNSSGASGSVGVGGTLPCVWEARVSLLSSSPRPVLLNMLSLSLSLSLSLYLSFRQAQVKPRLRLRPMLFCVGWSYLPNVVLTS